MSLTDPLLGQQVGSYRIEGLLGQGGMGRVYRAVQPVVGNRVAIKVLNEEFARDPELSERFFSEARAVALIAHENIVSVIDLVRLTDGRPVIIMELLEGPTLRDLIRQGPLPLGATVHVMLDVLNALGAAHAAGVVHRDLKPDNILVTAGGRAKVLDFGIAKLGTSVPGSGPRTRTGAVLGTPEYMAPEQISGGGVEPRTDVYAAGVVLFEAVTGKRPFSGPSDFEVMRAHVDTPPPSPRPLRPDLPVALEQAIARALAKRVDDRFADATEMARALHAASAELAEREWRSLTPHGRAFARPAPPQPPAPRTPAVALPHEVPTIAVTPVSAGTIPDTPAEAPTRAEPVRRKPVAQPRRSLVRWLIAGSVAAGLGIGAAVVLTSQPSSSSGATTSGVRTIEAQLPGDPASFDPVAYYPTALELARRLLPDAQLMLFKSTPVRSDGTVDLTQAAGKQNVYLFRSTAPAGDNGERTCVGVEPHLRGVVAFSYPTKDCEYPLAANPPRCTLSEVWSRAKKLRSFPENIVHISLLGEPDAPAYWYVDPSMGMRTGAGVRFDDDCSR